MSIHPRLFAAARVDHLLAAHRERAGLEGDDETILWHLLADIIEWCDEKHVDLDATLSGVREHFAEERAATMPDTLSPLIENQWVEIAKRNGWSGYGIAKSFCEAELDPDELAAEVARERATRKIIIKAGSTFRGVKYFEEAAFDVSPTLADEMILQGVARSA